MILWTLMGISSQRAEAAAASQPTVPRAQKVDRDRVDCKDPLLAVIVNALSGSPLAREVIEKLTPHHSQLEQMMDRHPDLFWEGIHLALQALPAVQSLAADPLNLRIDRGTFDRAKAFVARCAALATPDLARDLGSVEALVESRIREANSEGVLIDLGP